MELPRFEYHRIGQPLRELAQRAGEWVMSKVIPPEAVNGLFEAPAESLEE